MLIQEVTNAQDQLNLLKKIVDSTWSAIAAEAAAEEVARQQRAAATAAKPRARRSSAPITTAAATKTTAPKSSAAAATKAPEPAAASGVDKNSGAVQRDSAAALAQTQMPQLAQPRRAYPANTVKRMPVARLGKVAPVTKTQ